MKIGESDFDCFSAKWSAPSQSQSLQVTLLYSMNFEIKLKVILVMQDFDGNCILFYLKAKPDTSV